MENIIWYTLECKHTLSNTVSNIVDYIYVSM